MTDRDITYIKSDAWLLLAVLYASREGNAALDQVITAGDYINHAIFTRDELKGGLDRLSAGGFIKEKHGLYSVTSKVLKAYQRTTTPRRSVYKELEDMEQFLKIQV